MGLMFVLWLRFRRGEKICGDHFLVEMPEAPGVDVEVGADVGGVGMTDMSGLDKEQMSGSLELELAIALMEI